MLTSSLNVSFIYTSIWSFKYSIVKHKQHSPKLETEDAKCIPVKR